MKRPTPAGRYADIFAYSPVSGVDRRVGLGLVLAAVAGTVAVLPWARVPVPGIETLLPTVGAIAILAEILIAALFVSQYAISRHPPLFYVSVSFCQYVVFSTLSWTSMPYLNHEAGFFISSLQTPVWLIVWATTGWLIPLLLMIGCDYPPTSGACTDPRTMAGSLAGIILASAACVGVAYGAPDLFPHLVDGVRLTAFSARVVGPAVGVLVFGTLAALLAVKRLRDAIDVWLTVALATLCCEVTITVWGGSREALGFYAGRILWAGVGIAMLLQMLAKMYGVVVGLMTANRALDTQASTDELTGLPNRRAFNREVGAIFAEQRRDDRRVALLMVDLDEFKRYNDGFGHAAGDATLIAVVRAMRSVASRDGDTAARVGGEEFAVILRDTDLPGALTVAERLRAAVEGLAIPHAPGASFPAVTVSVGVAATGDAPVSASFEGLSARADAALYAAKRDGRNRIATAPIEV